MSKNRILVAQLRDRACPAGMPHTGDNPKDDHGHTDCWLYHQAADQIEHLQAECQKLANMLMSEYTWVHEYKIAEVDEALKPYLGGS